MALDKLKILVEKANAKGVYDLNRTITALFNPNKLAFTKSVNYQKQEAAQRDVPELEFKGAQPRNLNIDLILDTYDNDKAVKDDVREHTNKLYHLTTVEKHGDKHRPPLCWLSWGSMGIFFHCVVEKLDLQFTIFMEDGTPVRATARCSFKEWRTNKRDIQQQATTSPDIAKARIIKSGETLSSIAAEEYLDCGLWRPIAHENNIDDPLSLARGTVLLIPTLTRRSSRDRLDYDRS